MSGNFAFGATKAAGTGAATYTQTIVNFAGLPAVRVTVSR